jgi:hypothetical protein
MTKDTVLLFGTNTFTRHLIDWNRDDCEFWCWNEIGSLKDCVPNYWAKRVDTLIQIHASPIWKNNGNLNHGRQTQGANGVSHYDWLQRVHEYPIYMQDHYDDVPSSVKYPKEEIVKTLLPHIWRDVKGNIDQVENFTSSPSYAVALAIYQGKKQIELAGIEMTSDTEYVRQRPGTLFWLGIAVGRGINVVLHSPLLMNDKPYGYTGEVMIQRQEFEMSLRKLNELTEQSKAQAFEAKGRSQALLVALMKTTSQSDGERLLKEFMNALNIAQDAAFNYGEMAGRYQENSRYLAECDELIQAAGGEKALAVLMDVPYPVESEVQDAEKV